MAYPEKAEKALRMVKDKLQEKLNSVSIRGERAVLDGQFIGYSYPGRQPEHLLMLLHGGGFLMPGAANCQRLALELAESTGYSILSVEYPLTPENPYPAALDFLMQVLEGYSRQYRISLMGHSAGANLAAAAVLQGARPEKLVLNYPYLDLTQDPYKQERSARGVSAAASEVFRCLYCREEERALATVSPLLAQNPRFPKTLIIAAEQDGLLPDAVRFSEKLMQNGTECRLQITEGVDHSFIEDVYDMVSLKMTPPDDRTIRAARSAVKAAAEFLVGV